MRLLRWWWRRPSHLPYSGRVLLAAVLATIGLLGIAGSSSGRSSAGSASPPTKRPINPGPGDLTTSFPSNPTLISQGRTLYDNGCSSCHGLALQGQRGVGPALTGVGAGPIDFYLSTGRMPLQGPRIEPMRARPVYNTEQIHALIAFLTHNGAGPAVAPAADPSAGSTAVGRVVFTEHCAGCHQEIGRGGLTVGAWVPNLQRATPLEIAEAVRMGPYVMPHFDSQDIDQHELNSLVRYIIWTRHPSNAGGWALYNIGPIPEGMVAWFIVLLALVIVARLIGERTEGANS
jgi:quinol---cytochrome-c reductase cytochrome c subunit